MARDQDGNTPLHLLFKKNSQITSLTGLDEKHEKIQRSQLASIGEAVNLILSRAKETKIEPRRLLEIKNSNNEHAFGPHDKINYFQQHSKDLEAVAKTVNQGFFSNNDATGGSNESLLEHVIMQEAVGEKWNAIIWSKKVKSSVFYIVILLLFSVVSIYRVGWNGENSMVNSSLRRLVLEGEFGFDGTVGSTFDSIDSGEKALSFFDGLVNELRTEAWGTLIGYPAIKQWRSEKNSARFDHASFGNSSFQQYPNIFEAPIIFSGDTDWTSSWLTYPAKCFSLELLPSMDAEIACQQMTTRYQSSCPPSIKDVAENGFIDKKTRLLAFEAALYSESWKRFTFLRLFVEFRKDTGTVTSQLLRTYSIKEKASYGAQEGPEPDEKLKPVRLYSRFLLCLYV